MRMRIDELGDLGAREQRSVSWPWAEEVIVLTAVKVTRDLLVGLRQGRVTAAARRRGWISLDPRRAGGPRPGRGLPRVARRRQS